LGIPPPNILTVYLNSFSRAIRSGITFSRVLGKRGFDLIEGSTKEFSLSNFIWRLFFNSFLLMTDKFVEQ